VNENPRQSLLPHPVPKRFLLASASNNIDPGIRVSLLNQPKSVQGHLDIVKRLQAPRHKKVRFESIATAIAKTAQIDEVWDNYWIVAISFKHPQKICGGHDDHVNHTQYWQYQQTEPGEKPWRLTAPVVENNPAAEQLSQDHCWHYAEDKVPVGRSKYMDDPRPRNPEGQIPKE
jgi:hypothetical protein